MPLIRIHDLDYHYTDRGRGPAVLLLHGFTGSAASWEDLSGMLAGSCRVLAVDLPGHGRSGAPADPRRYGMEAVAADLAALIRAVDAAPAHLLGYSMGGRLALYVARRYPHRRGATTEESPLLRSLILESASPGLADPEARRARAAQDEALAGRIEREGVEAFVDAWEALPMWRSQAHLPATVRARLRRQRLANRPLGLANSLRGMGTGVQPPLWDELAAIDLPVLLLAGAEDEKFAGINREMAARLPRARLAIVGQAGHTIHLEQPGVFSAQLAAWLGGPQHIPDAEEPGPGR